LRGDKKENFIRKRALTGKRKKNIKKNYKKPTLKNEDFLEKSPTVLLGKTPVSIGHVEK